VVWSKSHEPCQAYPHIGHVLQALAQGEIRRASLTEHGEVELLVESDEFPELADGAAIPDLRLEVTATKVEKWQRGREWL